MCTYLENIKIIDEFYGSDFIKESNGIYLKKIIEVLYKDPDEYDPSILEKAKKISEKEGIIFKADGICGWKNLFDIYDGQENKDWLDKYKIIRASKYGELFFPGKEDKEKHRTINQQRYFWFGDRIDWTLFDIKIYIEEGKPRMSYENEYTKAYFDKFKKIGKGFKAFIDEMDLGIFVNTNYDVFNLSAASDCTISMGSDYLWSWRYGVNRKKEWLEKYLENLVVICRDNPK